MHFETIIGYLALVVLGLVSGFLSAIPIGAVQLQVIKKALKGHDRTALAIALGSGTSDLIYGVFTLFGLGGFMTSARFQICFYSLGIAVLSYLLYHSIHEHRNHIPGGNNGTVPERKTGFITGLTLAITNPSIVLWWIVAFKVAIDISPFTEATIPLRIIFILAGVAGLMGYLVILARIIHRIHRNLSDRVFHRMNMALIAVLIVVIGYFIYEVIRYVIPIISS